VEGQVKRRKSKKKSPKQKYDEIMGRKEDKSTSRKRDSSRKNEGWDVQGKIEEEGSEEGEADKSKLEIKRDSESRNEGVIKLGHQKQPQNTRYQNLEQTAKFGEVEVENEVDMFDKKNSNGSKTDKTFSQKKQSEDKKTLKTDPSLKKGIYS
jgi:hypothetical protein